MAITFIPRKQNTKSKTLLSVLDQVERFKTNDRQLDIAEAKLEESKLSGFSNRAQQAALTEQAKATAEATRIKNRIWKANPELAKLSVLNTNKNMLSQIKSMEATINLQTQSAENQAKLNALQSAEIIKGVQAKHAEEMAVADLAIKESQVVISGFNEQLKKSETQSKKFEIEDQARNQRLADFKDITKDMGVAGQNAAREAFMSGKPLDEIGQLGLEADTTFSEEQSGIERDLRIAETEAKKKSLSPGAQKRIDQTFGDETIQRRKTAEANRQPTAPVVTIEFDKTPGGRFTKAFDKDKPFKIDYREALTLKKDKEWLEGYQEAFGESYDIPEDLKNDFDKANGDKSGKESPQPPANIVELRDAKYPGAEIIFRDGKWGVVQ
jgi:hypothetical protein